jgi:hypothetical protein
MTAKKRSSINAGEGPISRPGFNLPEPEWSIILNPNIWNAARAIIWAIVVLSWNALAIYEMYTIFVTGQTYRGWGVLICLLVSGFVAVMGQPKRKGNNEKGQK